ncbi:MAG: TrmH family RNA methyltransferase [Anaerolineae bacterium]
MNAATWLEGNIAVAAALAAQSRAVHAVYVQRNKLNRETRRLRKLAEAAQVPFEMASPEFISEHAQGKTHGGVLASVGPRRMLTLADLLAGGTRPFIVMLDGVEDPFNFGQAVRSLYAAGATGLVLPPRNWMTAASVVARASAGASEWMPTAMAESAKAAADFFRAQGLVIAGTAAEKTAVSIYEADLTGPLFLLVGGEKRGITRSFWQQEDLRLTIPYGREFRRSLGVTASTAVIAFEIARQRRA